MKPLVALFFVLTVALASPGLAQSTTPEFSRCHAYVDHDYIWTLEIVQSPGGGPVPIVNVITFDDGEWQFRPENIHLTNARKKEARIDKLSVDTGIPEEPYLTDFLKILGHSFIGFDLVGDFNDFAEPREVAFDLDEQRFTLQPLECLEFEKLVDKVNQVNFDSPDVSADYAVLKIDTLGRREPVRRR